MKVLENQLKTVMNQGHAELVRALGLVSTSSEFKPDNKARFLNRAEKAERYGLYPTKDLAFRVTLCASCHVEPSPGRRITRATDVLRRNGLKSWTKPAPSLYPHQWSWDAAFVAVGLSHVDVPRLLEPFGDAGTTACH